MGDNEVDYEFGEETRFHLWRRFNVQPYRRFAMTVERAATDEGYEIVDHDPKVADSPYLAKFSGHMRAPMENVRDGGYASAGREGEYQEMIPLVQAGSLLHYENAIRCVPDTAVMASGRTT